MRKGTTCELKIVGKDLYAVTETKKVYKLLVSLDRIPVHQELKDALGVDDVNTKE